MCLHKSQVVTSSKTYVKVPADSRKFDFLMPIFRPIIQNPQLILGSMDPRAWINAVRVNKE